MLASKYLTDLPGSSSKDRNYLSVITWSSDPIRNIAHSPAGKNIRVSDSGQTSGKRVINKYGKIPRIASIFQYLSENMEYNQHKDLDKEGQRLGLDLLCQMGGLYHFCLLGFTGGLESKKQKQKAGLHLRIDETSRTTTARSKEGCGNIARILQVYST
jgi:hypothetical protein